MLDIQETNNSTPLTTSDSPALQLNSTSSLAGNLLSESITKTSTPFTGNTSDAAITPLATTTLVDDSQLQGMAVTSLESEFLTSQSASAAATSGTNQFQVVGTKIFDPNGVEFIAKGVNVNGPGFGWPGNTPSYVDEITGTWGFNAIRLNVQELQPSSYTYAENGTIDQIVQAYTQADTVVMIEPHEKTGKYWEGTELTRVADWFKDLASRYKDNPYVWFNTSNEPGATNSISNIDKWVTMNETITKAIRSTGADNIIVVDDHFWGQGSGQWNGDPVSPNRSAILSQGKNLVNRLGDDGNNIIFSLHVYDQWEFGDSKFNSYFDQAKSQGLPMIVGEYGATVDGRFKKATQSTLNTAVPRELGRFAWAWWGGDAWDLTTAGGGQKVQLDAQGNPANLTWFGQQVWNDLRRPEDLERMSSSTPTPTPTPIPTPTPTPTVGATMRIEAEKMQLTNYRVENQTAASGGQVISLHQSGSNTGSATGTFTGASGVYDVVVRYVDEYDGQGSLKVNLAGQSFDVALNQNLGAAGVTNQNLVKKTIASDLSLQSGASFKIDGMVNASEYARVDYLEFIAKNTAASTPTPTPTPAPIPTTPIRLEAEALQLGNYRIESNSVASASRLISLYQGGSNTGTATGKFSGPSGSYDIVVGYFDEDDGQGKLNVKVGSNSYDVAMNQNLGAGAVSSRNLVRGTLATGVALQPDVAIAITGTTNASEYARVDYLEFIPKPTTSSTALQQDELLGDMT